MTAALVLQTVALDTHRYRHSAAYPCRSFHFSCKGQLNIPGLNCSLHSHLSTASWKTHPPPCRWILHSSSGAQCKNKKSLCFVFALAVAVLSSTVPAGMTVPPEQKSNSSLRVKCLIWSVQSFTFTTTPKVSTNGRNRLPVNSSSQVFLSSKEDNYGHPRTEDRSVLVTGNTHREEKRFYC